MFGGPCGEVYAVPDLEQHQRQAVIAEAHTWLLTPFHDNQSLKGVGCDCLGFIVGVLRECGVDLYDRKERRIVSAREIEIPPYSPQFMCHSAEERYIENLLRYSEEVFPPGAPQPGDIAMFHFGLCYSHSGLVIEWPTKMIHCYVARNVELINPAIDPHLKRRRFKARFFDPWKGIP
jgi:NlpC/P60 family putative phage cell wall peptidase